MNIKSISTANVEIQAAFAEVQAVFPDLASVTYGDDLRWQYTLQSGEQPAFPAGLIDVSLLEAAADTLGEVPVTYTKE